VVETYSQVFEPGREYINYGLVLYEGLFNAVIAVSSFGIANIGIAAARQAGKVTARVVIKTITKEAVFGALEGAAENVGRQLVTGTKLGDLNYDQVTAAAFAGGLSGGIGGAIGVGVDAWKMARTAVSGNVAKNARVLDGVVENGSSFSNIPRPGDDIFIGPLTRPEHHFIFGEGIGKKQRGVVGAHNMNYFNQTLENTGFGLDELKIGEPIPHPTIRGIYAQKYTVPSYDGSKTFIGFKNIKEPKTVYDSTVISNRQMLDWGWEAMENGVVSGRIIEGSASNGLKFRGYIDDDGFVTNFFPIFE